MVTGDGSDFAGLEGRGLDLVTRHLAAAQRDKVAAARDRQSRSDPPARTLREARLKAARGRILAARDRDAAASDREFARALIEDLFQELALPRGGEAVLERPLDPERGRALLDGEIARAARLGAPLCVGVMGVEQAGEAVSLDGSLVRLGQELAGTLRPYDTAVPYGDREFLCILPGLAPGVALRRLNAAGKRAVRESERVLVTVGVAAWQPTMGSEVVIETAEAAMRDGAAIRIRRGPRPRRARPGS